MTYQADRISANQVRIQFTIPAEDFEAAVQQTYLTQRGRINVPGFRRGKAPRKLMETMFGASIFLDGAFDKLFPDAYDKALREQDIFAVDQPSVEVEQIVPGLELKFVATVYVKPEVTLGRYKGIKAVRHRHPIAQEQIDARIARDADKVTTAKDVTGRPLSMGDTADIDYLGSVDGVPFEGGEDQNHRLKLGEGQFIPGFEEQVAGMVVGEEKEITVTFPQEYHDASLAGKQAQFYVKINSATEEVRPELDDEFAQDVSEHQTFEAYRAAIVKELETQRDEQSEARLEDSIIQQAVDAADCDIPDAMVARETDRLLQNMRMQMLYQGIQMEEYLRYTNSSLESMRERFKPEARNNVKTQLVLEAVAKQEDIQPTDEDIDNRIDERARGAKDPQAYRDSITDRQRENFTELARVRKTVEMLKDNAEITLHEGDHEDEINPHEVMQDVQDALEQADAADDTDDKEGNK